MSRVHAVGLSETVRRALADAFGCEVHEGLPADPASAEAVVLSADATSAELPFGNAFAACRALKRAGVEKVFVAVAADDPFSGEIARFCMADDSLRIDADGRLLDADRIAARLAPRRARGAVDAILARLERDATEDESRRAAALERILQQSGEATFLERLTDAETGLFDGPYAAFKLDEEIKRAQRFHQPLSVALLDCGVAAWPEDAIERRTLLAEIASTFLNHCRDIDVLARFTETVFLFLLPGTGPDGAATLARRMVEELGRREFVVPARLDPRVGVVTVPDPDLRDRQSLLLRAEELLRAARQGHGQGGICSSAEGAAAVPE